MTASVWLLPAAMAMAVRPARLAGAGTLPVLSSPQVVTRPSWCSATLKS
jgi:hypothetical protein